MSKNGVSLETRLKISNAVKAAHERKLDENFMETSKSRKLMRKLVNAFSEGHPDKLEVAAIRNYGDFGIERRVKDLEDRKKATLPEHKEIIQEKEVGDATSV